ncbi:N-acetylmuramoyl-L-alanine amidase [Cellulosimicrobium funkei]|uniref:Peptidoglycan recognition protein family domain-containing protein n=1 Tax=Cellulosimicrobium funkei TaxID=264251 RepID=A0A4Y8R1E6_9MICO|nr:N-acetylmuramoyl-L-alanine amidase [Cellulosimicrobium funkei]TFF08569.1 hypothetical protein E1O70_13125 [Cellulosimicrobium funkei]TGA72961.1 hypothetical protein EQW79_011920 [Cellulosimicrobium terreum]
MLAARTAGAVLCAALCVPTTAGAASAAPTAQGPAPNVTVAVPGDVTHPAVDAQQDASTDVAAFDLGDAPVVPADEPAAPDAQVSAEVAAAQDAPVLGAVPARAVDVDGATIVGVTWKGTVSPDRVEVRAQGADDEWSEWTALEPEQDPDGDGGGTDPWFTGGAARVEVRAWGPDGPMAEGLDVAAISTDVTDVDKQLGAQAPGVQLVGSRGSSAGRSAALAGPLRTGTAPAPPTVISRAQWGADPALMTWTPQYAQTTVAAVLHHTAGSNSYTPAQSPGIVRGIYAYHAQSRGWGDIGYNVLVDQYGQIFEGRFGGLTMATVAAHAGGFNSGTFGVSMMGDYSSVAPSAALRESVARIIAWRLGGSYLFDPWEVSTYVTPGHSTSRFSPGTGVRIYRILAHRDVAYTSCPGNAGYSILPWLRNRVGELTGAAKTQIWSNWQALGRTWGDVGQLESDVGTGSAAYFTNGFSATYEPGVGVHSISPRIRPGWLAGSGFTGMGFPRSFEFDVGDRRGRAQEFSADASVVWSPQTGSQAIGGDLRRGWWREGGATGWLGYPTTSQRFVGDGRGVFIEFESTGSLLSTPTTGTAAISGALRSEWWRTGGATGTLGYPNRTQSPVGDGRGLFVEFEKGGSVLWTPTTGARTLTGGVRAAWWRSGGATGLLGYPTRSEGPVGDGVGTFAEFEGGGTILATASTGAHVIHGPVRHYWYGRGGVNGLGYPTTDQKRTADGSGWEIDLAAGVTTVSAPSGATYTVWGAIRDRWRAAGGTRGPGYPVSEPVNYAGRAGGYSSFSSGAQVAWTPTTGALLVPAAVARGWSDRGGYAGRLGVPVAEAVTTGGTTTQRFEGGTLTVRDGVVTG